MNPTRDLRGMPSAAHTGKRPHGSQAPPARYRWRACLATMAVALLIGAASAMAASGRPQRVQLSRTPDGVAATFTTNPFIDTTNPFFQSLGTNGRACVTCHQPTEAWSITPAGVQASFDETAGLDPIFRPNDGANCPTADVSTVEARRNAYNLLLTKGLIRVSLAVPSAAEFRVVAADDPYGCSTASELSVYRRPLPSTNLKFLSAVMWDGRETFPGKSLEEDLLDQAVAATLGHAEASQAPTEAQLQQILTFEMGLFTAQLVERDAGSLVLGGARGGPMQLSQQEFYLGINDPLGGNPTGTPFNPEVFDLFTAWEDLEAGSPKAAARAAVARGEQIFNSRPVAITGVAGLNDALNQPVIMGFCTTCHDTPNAGNHSLPVPLNIGISDASHRTPDLPLFTLECLATGQVVQTTDPGRALITGKCVDIGKIKGPILRGLSPRAPYFHNGAAATLRDVVEFYNTRFQLQLTPQEMDDVVAFLQAL
jgi:cytochrome c peroxidase